MEFITSNLGVTVAVAVIGLSLVLYFTKSKSPKPTAEKSKVENLNPPISNIPTNSVFYGQKEATIHPKLIEKTVLTSGVCPVKLYRFQLDDPKKSLGLPIGQHIWLTATIDGEEVKRSYTPSSTNDDLGFFDLVVKVYPKGKMSQYLDQLKIGDTLMVSGPKGRFVYEKNKYAKIGMIAGGTGITPMLQVIKEILKHQDDNTQVSLLFGNITEQDIILKEMIEELSDKHPRFKPYHVLNEPPEGWKQGVGFISKQMIQDYMPEAGENMNILMCGPLPMTNGMTKILKEELGYERKHYFCF
ncbi:cytochrome-b5 reductase [Acrasis kona]|uniref:NADH-cytochrome b5 reductase n=1 Tax=Acrasis kona TaxID=1008807 RepID=A0AAW2ZJS3_9EUKA